MNCRGSRLVGARIELEGTLYWTLTNSWGLYVIGPIHDLLPGTYRLTASADGHLVHSLTLNLPASGTLNDINFAGIHCLQPVTSMATLTPTTPPATATTTPTPTPTGTRLPLTYHSYMPVVVADADAPPVPPSPSSPATGQSIFAFLRRWPEEARTR